MPKFSSGEATDNSAKDKCSSFPYTRSQVDDASGLRSQTGLWRNGNTVTGNGQTAWLILLAPITLCTSRRFCQPSFSSSTHTAIDLHNYVGPCSKSYTDCDLYPYSHVLPGGLFSLCDLFPYSHVLIVTRAHTAMYWLWLVPIQSCTDCDLCPYSHVLIVTYAPYSHVLIVICAHTVMYCLWLMLHTVMHWLWLVPIQPCPTCDLCLYSHVLTVTCAHTVMYWLWL